MAKGTFADRVGRDDLSVRKERALLVAVLTNGGPLIGDPLAELAELARSAGAEVVSRAAQKRRSFNAATCVGKGKLEELRQRADAHDVDVVIFDNDLTPAQIREIEAATQRKVIDRSELILDIFASRARTAEARLQVELAQLEYTAPRLRGMWTHLERDRRCGRCQQRWRCRRHRHARTGRDADRSRPPHRRQARRGAEAEARSD